MSWSDENFDYFLTSDGHLFYVRRNLVREAHEARHKLVMHRMRLTNMVIFHFVCLFVGADFTFLVFAIVSTLLGGTR